MRIGFRAALVACFAILGMAAAGPAFATACGTATSLDFSSGTFKGWNLGGVGEVEPTIVSEHAESGKAAKFLTEGTTHLSELVLGGEGTGSFEPTELHDGGRYLFTFKAFVPTSQMTYATSGHHNTIWQLHPNGSEGAALSLELGEYGSKGLYVVGENTAGKGGQFYVAPFSEGTTHIISIEVVGAENQEGSDRVWLDGNLVWKAIGVETITANSEANKFGYIKMGINGSASAPGVREIFDSQVEFTELCEPPECEAKTTSLDFSSGTFNGWNLAGVGEVEPTIVSEHAESGKAAKFAIEGSTDRSGLILGGEGNHSFDPTELLDGGLYRYTFKAYVPSGRMTYATPGHHNTIWQLHPRGAEGPALSLELGEYALKGLYVVGEDTAGEGGHFYVAPFSEGITHTISIEVLGSEGKEGLDKVWLDGSLVWEATGVETIATSPETEESGYIKMGIYSAVTGVREIFDSQVEFTELCAP